MFDIKLIRDSPDLVKKDIKRRYSDFPIDDLIKKDEKWRKVLQKLEKLRHKRNIVSQEIAKTKDKTKIKEMQEVKEEIKKAEERTRKLEEEINELLIRCPNLMHKEVPKGKDEKDNIEIKKVGKIVKKKYEIKAHGDWIEDLNLGNFDTAAKVAGRGFNYLIGDLALLDRALQNYAIDFLMKKGFVPVFPPFMLGREAYEGAIDMNDFEDDMYKIENEDSYLIASSEAPLIALHKDEVIPEDKLPIRLAGISTCFRKEIGSHGVDTKGLFRMHQFNKIEQIIICKPEDSYKYFEETQKLTEKMFKELGIPFRVIEICSGDLSIKNAKQYDIEAWFPRQNKYSEVTSDSNCTDFQSRALNIKYGKRGGDKEFVHIINNTGIATSRAMVAILENFQNKDGTVTIPKVLRPYMYNKEKIGLK